MNAKYFPNPYILDNLGFVNKSSEEYHPYNLSCDLRLNDNMVLRYDYFGNFLLVSKNGLQVPIELSSKDNLKGFIECFVRKYNIGDKVYITGDTDIEEVNVHRIVPVFELYSEKYNRLFCRAEDNIFSTEKEAQEYINKKYKTENETDRE